MISGILAAVGGQPLRTRGMFFRAGSYLGVPQRILQAGAALASSTDCVVLNVPSGGNFVLGTPPNGITTNQLNDPREGKNNRGVGAVDLQIYKVSDAETVAQVASGVASFIGGGTQNTASGAASAAFNYRTAASGLRSFACGYLSVASASFTFAGGNASTASGQDSFAIGNAGLANRIAQFSMGTGGNGWASGNPKANLMSLSGLTSSATPLTLLAKDSSANTGRLTITSGTVVYFDATIIGSLSDGTAIAKYRRAGIIKNVGGTTTLVSTLDTVGVDTEDNVLTDVAVTADDTNDALQISVTGVAAQTWRWMADVWFTELPYGT